MAKKLLSVWLSMTILLFSSISIYAGDVVKGQFFLKNISINGTQIFNYELNSPLFTYKGATYVPVNSSLNEALGLRAEMDWESRTLKLWKTAPTKEFVSDGKLQSNLKDVNCEIASDVTVLAYEPLGQEVAVTTEGGVETEAEAGESAAEAETKADVEQIGAKEEIVLPNLQATKLNLGELPLLIEGNTVYFPIKILAQQQLFGWSLYYDEYSGLYISTDAGTSAQSHFNEPQSRYIRGLVNYIRKCNSSVGLAEAEDLVGLFQHEARIYNVDHTLLIAMAQKESTFNADARSSSGSLGMMQILPSTARANGVNVSQLTDPHVNIEFGSKYLRDRLDMYKGNVTLALSAYNQGAGAVNRGSYTTRYAGRVIGAQADLNEYLAGNGYGKGY